MSAASAAHQSPAFRANDRFDLMPQQQMVSLQTATFAAPQPQLMTMNPSAGQQLQHSSHHHNITQIQQIQQQQRNLQQAGSAGQQQYSMLSSSMSKSIQSNQTNQHHVNNSSQQKQEGDARMAIIGGIAETEPAAKEPPINGSLGYENMKRANTAEYPKENDHHVSAAVGNHHHSPSQHLRREGKQPMHIIPSLAIEVAKMSQGGNNSERKLIENAEPSTPISNLVMQRQGSNQQVLVALNALNQLATQNKALHGKILSTLKQRETPEYRYEFSPQRLNSAATSNNHQAGANANLASKQNPQQREQDQQQTQLEAIKQVQQQQSSSSVLTVQAVQKAQQQNQQMTASQNQSTSNPLAANSNQQQLQQTTTTAVNNNTSNISNQQNNFFNNGPPPNAGGPPTVNNLFSSNGSACGSLLRLKEYPMRQHQQQATTSTSDIIARLIAHNNGAANNNVQMTDQQAERTTPKEAFSPKQTTATAQNQHQQQQQLQQNLHNQQTPQLRNQDSCIESIIYAANNTNHNNNEKSIKQMMEKHLSVQSKSNIFLPEECESLIMRQYDNILNSKSSLNFLTSEGRQFEDIQNMMHSQYLQNAAGFNQSSISKKFETTSLGLSQDRRAAMEGDDDTSKINIMQKSMSLNMNFHPKASQDGSLTKALNNFLNPINPSGKQQSLNIVGSIQTQQQLNNMKATSATYVNFPQSPGDMLIQRSPSKSLQQQVAQQHKIGGAIKIAAHQGQQLATPTDVHMAESNLPPAIHKKSRVPSSFGSVGAMAMAKLMQHHANTSGQQKQSQSSNSPKATTVANPKQPLNARQNSNEQLNQFTAQSQQQNQQATNSAGTGVTPASTTGGLRLALKHLQDSCSTIQEGCKSPPSCKDAQIIGATVLDNNKSVTTIM